MGLNSTSPGRRAEAVVVGAGLGGLGAALELARGGVKVLVLEQHNLPGGFATSFVRGRFEFEPSLHQMPGTLPGSPGVKDYLLREAGVDLEVADIPEAYRLILTENSLDLRVPFGIEAVTDLVAREVPGSRQVVTDYLALCGEVLFTLFSLEKQRRELSPRQILSRYRNFISSGAATVQEVGDAMGLPPRVRDILYPYWCYLGVPASRLSFTLWAALLYTYLAGGAFIPSRRSHGLAAAMVKRIEELGGRVRQNVRVAAIEAPGGSVRAVLTAAGERIACERVICNLSPSVVFNNLITPSAAVPKRARRLVNARRLGFSTFVVYLGLNEPARELGLEDYSYFISTHMDTDRIYDSTAELKPPQMQAAVCLNNAVPDCSPRGTTILSLTACYQPQVWERVSAREYASVKTEIARGMIEQFEAAAGVNLRKHIEEIEIATPQTFGRYTGAYRGGVYGYEAEPWDSLVPRTLAQKKERFLTGLDFCGGFSERCHGYGSSLSSGSAAGRRALAEMSR
jgi:phytoene dehydrogenase-like protein